jgi:iron complex outermembrane receptor protein
MKLENKRLNYLLPGALFGLFLTTASAQEGKLTELDAFIAEETAAEDADTLLPTETSIGGAFFSDMAIIDTPRSVNVLTPELMEEFRIEDFDDLQKIGAGTEQVNFYGVPGSPAIRGWKGGVFFNGVMRAWQRNEMPTSFGALEAMEVVKGVAPAQFITSQVGGYVNMLPKSPFFDKQRGEVAVKVGSHNYYNLQADYGAPFLLFDETPAAYRVSLTVQQADKYWDRIGNDFVSLYASMKVKASDRLSFFFGGEYFDYNSNENAGWNRPTQNLLDNGEYVIGEPLSLVRLGNGGVADRNLIDQTVWLYGSFGDAPEKAAAFRALVVPAGHIDAALADGTLTGAQVALMRDLSDAAVRADLYSGLPEDVVQTTSGYLYTPEFFEAGGTVLTERIAGNQVLSDRSDFANSENFIFFFDTEFQGDGDTVLVNKFFMEDLKTDKLSSYGYSLRSEQFILNDRLEANTRLDFGENMLDLKYGGEIRYTEAIQLQDFWVEPFARRDITLDRISSNSVILSGAQTDPLIGDNNYWGGGFGAEAPAGHAVESELIQTGAFVTGLLEMGDLFSIIGSARYEIAQWDVSVPDGPTDIAPNSYDGDTDYFNWSLNPTLKLGGNASLYAVYQEATTYAPLQGGPITGEENFGDSELKEGGVKVSLMEGTLFATAAYYEWEQAAVNNFSATSEQFSAEGVELELTWAVTDTVTLIASWGDREVRKISDLGFRTMPFALVDPTGAGNDEIGVALESGSLLQQFAGAFGGFTPEGATPTDNPERVVPSTPETVLKLFAAVDLPGGFGISGGIVHQDSYWHNYDRTLRLDSSLVANANLSWENEVWEVIVSVDNLTDEDYFLGADPEFAANTLITKAPGREYFLTVKYKF